MTRPDVLPSTIYTVSAPRIGMFRCSMAGLCPPLSTLRRNPRGQLRMTRGRCGSLLLHRKRLALSTPCRSPGASQMFSALPPESGHCSMQAGCLFGVLAPEGSWFLDHFVGAFFLAQASRLYKQEAR